MVLYMLYTCEKQKTLGSIRKNFEKICVVLVDNGKIQLFWDNVFSKAARYDSMIRIRFDCPEWMCGGNMVKAVFFDVDGTLVSHTHHAVPESTRISLNKLHEGGIQRVIATGRHLDELSRMPVKGISFDAYMRNPTQSTAVSIKTLSLIQRKRPFPVQMYRKRQKLRASRRFLVCWRPCFFI